MRVRMRVIFVAGSRILIGVAADRSGSSVIHHPCTNKVCAHFAVVAKRVGCHQTSHLVCGCHRFPGLRERTIESNNP